MGIAFSAGRYIHWGVMSVSLTNFLIMMGMIVIFVLALVVPFPGHARRHDDRDDS